MDKGTKVQEIYEAVDKARKAGIGIAFFIQFGYSGETWQDILLTREMIRQCIPDDIGISVSYPLPGTVFYERVKEQMKLKTNWMDSDDLDMIFNGTFDRKFYKLLHKMVHNEFRMIRIIKYRQLSKILNLLYYFAKFTLLRIRLNKYLKDETMPDKIHTKIDFQVTG
jgi:radical SAM superfamily enzyme YgiQ (UPF0313 family)